MTRLTLSRADVMVVSPTLHRKALSDFLSSDEANVSLNVSLEAYDADDESTGTMQVLSKIAPKINVCPNTPSTRAVDSNAMADRLPHPPMRLLPTTYTPTLIRPSRIPDSDR
jgi:hypothetical protein